MTLVRSASVSSLWDGCVQDFLDELGDSRGPRSHPSHLWLAHRNLRDRVFEEAYARGLHGWLGPPFSFFSELPERFGIRARPLGLLTRRRLVARIAAEAAGRAGMRVVAAGGVARAHMVDGLLGELLPEGVKPGALKEALDALDGDDFTRRRDAWVVDVFAGYLEALREREVYDPRSINAMVAERVEGGGLPDAIRGAETLHVYGTPLLRTRRRLFRALAAQGDVAVRVYLVAEDEPGEWDALAADAGGRIAVEELIHPPPAPPRVQPVPDSLREMRWLAAEVKRRVVEDGLEPHDVAVVARTGREDTGRAYRALRSAGLPATARVRRRLSDVAAMRAFLEVLRGVADDWPYRALRNVVVSPYLYVGIPTRVLDLIARRRQVAGLDEWREEIRRLAKAAAEEADQDARRMGVAPDRSERWLEQLDILEGACEPLRAERPEVDWARASREWIVAGALGFRSAACKAVGERYEIVRFDQRAIRHLEKLLHEWAELDLDPTPIDAAEWHRRLSRVLSAQELVLSTPMQKGVQILEAHDAALTPFRAVYVVHANDGVFPRAPGIGGVLSEEERETLGRLGLPITDRDGSMRRERALWRSVTSHADLTVSYRTTDAEGRPLLPSIMVPDHDQSSELPRTYEPIGAPVSPAQQLQAAAASLRRARQASGRDASAPSVPVPDPAAFRHALLAAVGEQARGVRRNDGTQVTGANPWHGELRDPVVLEQLAERFGPDRVWSASQLQLYGRCPFLYLAERVLYLTPSEEAEEETSALQVGSIAHAILERFYSSVKSRVPVALEDGAASTLHRVTEAVFQDLEDEREWLGHPVLWRHRKEEIREIVRAYVEWELPYLADKGERPWECELALGGDTGFVEIQGPDLNNESRTMRIRGRVDRVDAVQGGERSVYRILDYKTSYVPAAKGYQDGSHVQAPLYMAGVEAERGIEVACARYRALKRPGSPQNGAQINAGPKAEAALRFAFSIPERIRSGVFEPVMAGADEWKPWDPGIELTRGRVQLADDSRFDADGSRFDDDDSRLDADGTRFDAEGTGFDAGTEARS